MLLITQVLLGFLIVLTVAEAVPVSLNTTSVVDPIPVGAGSSLLADEKTGPYRLTFFKSAIGNNKDITTNENNKTVEVLMNKSNEEINQTVHADESSMEQGDPIEMKFTGDDWSKKLTKIIDKESSSGIDSSSSSSSEEDSSSSSEEDSSENGSGDSSEEEEEEEGSEEEEEEESKEEEEEEEEGGSEEEEEGEEEEEEKESEGEEEEEEKEEEEEEENEEEDEEGKEIEKVLNVDIKKTSAVITPAGTQLMNSSDHDVYFHEMQRHHKKFGSTTKGTKLLFTSGLIPSSFYSHFLQDNSIIPSSVVQQTSTSSNNIKTMYSDWLKSLPEMKKLSHPHFISSIVKPIKKNKADDVMNKSISGNQLTPGGTRLVSDDHWLSLYNNDDVMHRQPSLLDDDSVQRFFRSAAAFRTLSPPPPQ